MAVAKTKKKVAPKKAASRKSTAKATARTSPAGKKQAGKGANGLHLPSLTIKGFRGIKELNLSGLGRVTLLVGGNGVGKSTVLEAMRIYSSGGAPNVMNGILRARGNMLERVDEGGDSFYVPDHGSLFFGYEEPRLGDVIKIGCAENGKTLEMKLSQFERKELEDIPPQFLSVLDTEGFRGLAISSGSKRKKVGKLPFISSKKREFAEYSPRLLGSSIWNQEGVEFSSISYRSLGPGLPSNEEITSWYGNVALTPAEEDVLRTLHFINADIERLASVTGENREPYIKRNMGGGVRMIVGLKDVDSQIPLESLGDGTVRLLAIVLALINTKNGFLLLDEVENGFHYGLFTDLWEFVMRTAEENNVQVIAATHSWDCVKGFAEACRKSNAIKGRLIRIDREGDRVWPVSYPGEDLTIATEAGIEVR